MVVSYKSLKNYLQNLKYNAKRAWFFIWFWLVFHPAWYCPLRTGGWGLLNRLNLSSVRKVISRWSLATWYVSISQWNIQQYLTYHYSLPSDINVSLKKVIVSGVLRCTYQSCVHRSIASYTAVQSCRRKFSS